MAFLFLVKELYRFDINKICFQLATLENFKFILNFHLKMSIYGGKFYSQVFQKLTCDENSMKTIFPTFIWK